MRSTRRDGATIKRERLHEMEKMLTQPGVLPVEKNWMVAQFEYHFGLSKRAIFEYLGNLEERRVIRIEPNMICKPRNEDRSP